MGTTKLKIQQQLLSAVAVDSKVTKEAAAYEAETRALAIRDERTRKFLHTACCDAEQTAQLFHYMVSKPCSSVCSTIDIPADNEWGGWYQWQFLVFYTRSLIETIDRIKEESDRLLKSNLLPRLETELQIAKQCFRSAEERDQLETKKIALEKAEEEYNNINSRKDMIMQSSSMLTHGYKIKQIELRRTQNQVGLYIKHCETSENNINQFKREHPNGAEAQICRRKLNSLIEESNQNRTLLDRLKKDASNMRTMLQSLKRQTLAKEKEIAEQKALLEKAEQARVAARKDFEEYQKTCRDNLYTRVLSLKMGENYCHAAGFKKHALYINFKNGGDFIQVEICNLGAGNNYHPYIEGNSSPTPELFLPKVIRFKNNATGKANLQAYCRSITEAITEPAAKASPLLYLSPFGTNLTREEYNKSYSEGKISAELAQITGNCTSKGYFQALRERMGNPEIYANLMLSLFVWSKNLYFLRRQQSPAHGLVTADDISHLRKSEAVFKDKTESWFRDTLNNFSTTTPVQLLPRPMLQPVPQPVPPLVPQATVAAATAVAATAAAARPPLLHAYSKQPQTNQHFYNQSFPDSLFNRPDIDEDELQAALFVGHFNR